MLLTLAFLFSCSGSDAAVISYGSLYDSRDGQTYKTVAIGSQTWMAENLNYNASGSARYNYGRLYNWSTALSACPSGWHLPSDDEWQILVEYADPDFVSHTNNVAGRKLKATSGWNSGGSGTNDYGFSALPGGSNGSSDGIFINVGRYGLWWSTTEDNASDAWFRGMYYDNEHVGRNNLDKSNLFSVRCLRD